MQKVCKTFCERYFKAGAEQCDLLDRRELFSFGSGCFYDGQDAVETIDSNTGSFISCNLTLSTLILLDRKKTQGHLATLGCLDKAVTLRELLQTLEDKGEATSHPTETHCQQLSHIKSVSVLPEWTWTIHTLSGQRRLFPPHRGLGKRFCPVRQTSVLRFGPG